MITPVWVIAGLLNSGKTTLVNRLIEQELDEQDILVIRFESGKISLTEQKRVKELVFSKSQLEQIPLGTADTITHYIDRHSPDLVLVEWNGMECFHRLEEVLFQFTVKAVLSIEKVVYAADGASFKARTPDAGAIAFSQIAGNDCAYIRLRGYRWNWNDMDIFYNCNSDIRVYTSRDRFACVLLRFGMRPRHCLLMTLTVVTLYMMVSLLLDEVGIPSGRYVSMFLGVFLQAASFLAIGVLLSSLVQIYLRTDRIQKRLLGKILAEQLFAVIAGSCPPVCDYVSIPVLKSLAKKRVPMPAVMTLMLVSPIINPVVTFSTWYAFNGNHKIVTVRCGSGILYVVLCGLTYLFKPPTDYLIEQAMPFRVVCVDHSLSAETGTRLSCFSPMMRHAQNEFFSVGKFPFTGILASTPFQDMIPQAVVTGGAGASWRAFLVIMGLAFVPFLCSSSDAVVARSIAGGLPAGAAPGSMVFGPMMDIRNAAMLLSGFKSGFVIHLFATTFLICFIATGVFIIGGSGGIRI